MPDPTVQGSIDTSTCGTPPTLLNFLEDVWSSVALRLVDQERSLNLPSTPQTARELSWAMPLLI